ncbi:MAG: PAS domain-containing protein [Myxococcota bacterium]|nr:PAS domain-containing protein [Myxococcota bacterium]
MGSGPDSFVDTDMTDADVHPTPLSIAPGATQTGVANELPEIVFEVDGDGRLTFLNRQGLEILGYDPHDISGGLTFLDLIAHEDRAMAEIAFAKSASRDQLLAGEFQIRRKDNTGYPGLVRIRPIQDRRGELTICGIIFDISALKRTENYLKRSRERFLNLAEQLPESVFEIDEMGVLSFFNQQAIVNFGYTFEELMAGFFAVQLFPEADRAGIQETLKALTTEASGVRKEITALRKDGSTFPVRAHFSTIVQDEIPIGVRVMCVDISEFRG